MGSANGRGLWGRELARLKRKSTGDPARRVGCGLLIKGAYAQSRLRQMVFGRATQHILANAALPVLLANGWAAAFTGGRIAGSDAGWSTKFSVPLLPARVSPGRGPPLVLQAQYRRQYPRSFGIQPRAA